MATSTPRRPRVICHMMASVDGRIAGTDDWPQSANGRKQYELIHQTYAADGWLCGRVTMEQHFAQRTRSDAEVAREHASGAPRDDFVAPGEHESFAFAVDTHVDLSLALEKIGQRFDVSTLMLEGGGRINGGMLRAGLVDEVSVLVAPVLDGRIGTPALFDVDGNDVVPCRLLLDHVERRADDVLWLRYRVDTTP